MASDPFYTSLGKQVLRDGKHFADAIHADAATAIAAAMNLPAWIEAKADKRLARRPGQRQAIVAMRMIAGEVRAGMHEDFEG